jgi:hypothetical protein
MYIPDGVREGDFPGVIAGASLKRELVALQQQKSQAHRLPAKLKRPKPRHRVFLNPFGIFEAAKLSAYRFARPLGKF